MPRYRTLRTRAVLVAPWRVASRAMGEIAAVPPGQDPAQEGSKTGADGDLGGAGGGFVGAIAEPFAEPLAERVTGAEGEEGGEDRGLTGRAGEDGAVDPEGQTALLGGAESRQVLGKGGLDLVQFGGTRIQPPARRVDLAPPYCQLWMRVSSP